MRHYHDTHAWHAKTHLNSLIWTGYPTIGPHISPAHTTCTGSCRRPPVAGVGRRMRGMEAVHMRGGLAAAGAGPDGLARKQVCVARRAAVQARVRALGRPRLLLQGVSLSWEHSMAIATAYLCSALTSDIHDQKSPVLQVARQNRRVFAPFGPPGLILHSYVRPCVDRRLALYGPRINLR